MGFHINARHPLRQLFTEIVYRNLSAGAQIRDADIAEYVAGVLTDFTHVDNLYRIRSARGKRLEDVGEMLIESNPLLEGRSFLYEREVRKHIGDYTLFLAGLFPEYVARLPRQHLRLDAFVDYLKAGKESYRVVASFNQFEYRDEAPLFSRLSSQFELCVFGLNLVKQDLQHMRDAHYGAARDLLEGNG